MQHDSRAKKQFDKRARDLNPLQKDQPVYYQNPETPGWHPGKIKDKTSQRSYIVEGENGGLYTRNRVHLRTKSTQFEQRSDPVCDDIIIERDACSPETQPPDQQPTTSRPTSLESHSDNRPASTAQNPHYTTRSGRIVKPNPKYM